MQDLLSRLLLSSQRGAKSLTHLLRALDVSSAFKDSEEPEQGEELLKSSGWREVYVFSYTFHVYCVTLSGKYVNVHHLSLGVSLVLQVFGHKPK